MWTSVLAWAGRVFAASALGEPDDSADRALQAMARRQFKASVIVGLALLVVAALIAVQAPQVAPARISAQHKITRPEAPRVDTAQPVGEKNPGG
jgi:predicted secreted protein